MALETPDYDGKNHYVGPMEELMQVFQPKNVLEIGLGHFGYSTNTWLGKSDAKVTTVDKGDWKGYGERYKLEYPKRFKLILGYTDEVLPKLKPKSYDFIFIDGDHSFEGCKSDILNCMKLVTDDGLILLDDYFVPFMSAIDVDDFGNPIDGMFGVGRAVDECFDDDWKQVFTDIGFANQGRVYAKAQSRVW